MNPLVGHAYALFGRLFERDAIAMRVAQMRLYRASYPTRAAAYHSMCLVIALVVGLTVAAALFFVMHVTPIPLWGRAMLAFAMGITTGVGTFFSGLAWLDLEASRRGAELDENLPHGLNYMLALANAGLAPKLIWGSLGRQKVFGPLADEAERIHRDLDVFGHDLIHALRQAQERSPSKRFTEFLQGAISAFRSGVELSGYLKTKSAQYQHEQEQTQQETLDTMALMAEAFLVVVVAAPLFMIIMLTVMSITQGASVIAWGQMLVLGFIPFAQALIGGIIRTMNPKIWT